MEQTNVRTYIRTKPGKVDGYLLAKVLSDVIQRLVLVPLAPGGPIVKEDLSHVQVGRVHTMTRVLKRSLQGENIRIVLFKHSFKTRLE